MAQTILVVDDEPRLVDLVTTILESQGYAVIEADDGDGADRRARPDARPRAA